MDVPSSPESRQHAPSRWPRLTPPAEADRHTALHADVTARLRGVCAGMEPEVFDALVRDICAMKIRWEADTVSR